MKSVEIEEYEIFLGFKAYSESDAGIFKGRDNDIECLFDLVSNNDYVLCYAESGEGKSSLIDAGLTPKLRKNRCFPVKIAFTEDDYNDENIDFDKVIKSRIENAIADYCTNNENAKFAFFSNLNIEDEFVRDLDNKFGGDIWWMLRNNELFIYGIPFTLVLIFDQFEEVINCPKSKSWTNRFFSWLEKISLDKCPQYILDDINKCVENNDSIVFPDIKNKKKFKAVFSIRTEYIGELDYWCMQRYFIPEFKHNRFCLKPLTLLGADEVMKQYEGFDDEFRDSIKNVLLMSKDNRQCARFDEQSCEPHISALVLSVVCTSLYQNCDKIFTASMITDSINVFYNDIIKKCNISEKVRNVIASVLIDKGKRVRVSTDCNALEKIDFNNKYKEVLLQNRLIKKCIVNGVEYIELVHDSLIDVVKKHKEEALRREMKIRRIRSVFVVCVLFACVLFLIHHARVENNEANLLRSQVNYCCSKSRELSIQNDIDAIKLLLFLAENNKGCFNNDIYIQTVRDINNLYSLRLDVLFLNNVYNNAYSLSKSNKVYNLSNLSPISEILDKWSDILGPNAELTPEEKEKYFLN